MPSPFPLSALRIFEAAAHGESFRAAAEELRLTPSAVSHAIHKLEEEVGALLFTREGRRMTLTPEGRVLLAHVEQGFSILRQGVQAVSTRRRNFLRLHAAPSFAAQWLMPRLGKLRRAYPELELRLAAGTDYTRFLSDEYDADIVYGEPQLPGAVIIPLGEERVAPMCTPHLAAAIESIEDLEKMPLIDSDNKKVRWDRWFAANGRAAPPSSGLRFDRSFLAIAAAIDELGVALESTRLAEKELAEGRLVLPLAGKARDVTYVGHFLVFPQEKRILLPLRRFIEWLMRELGLAAADEGL
jgi:LysR family glycine cleavage system transcriptional activator